MKHIHFDQIASTHLWVREHQKELAPNAITIITAGEQTAGIGRKKDPWIATKDENLLATFFFPKPTSSLSLQNIAQLLAYSALKTLENREIYLQFKWPNDLISGGKKVGGILADILEDGIAVSIGLNVNMDSDSLKAISPPATSLFTLTGEKQDLEMLTRDLAREFKQDLELFFLKGFSAFVSDFAKFLAYVGSVVEINGRQGVIKKLANDGRLLVETSAGEELFATGSVNLLPLE